MAEEMPKSIYNFTVKDIQGNDVSLNNYTGKVLLIVNVASKCGLTHSNYKELNVLYEKYKNQGQEPGSNEEIKEVVCTMFKAEFPVFDKVEVNGKNAAPLYKFLKSQKGGLFGDGIKWNFTKFLVNKDGKVVERYAPTTSPLKIEV
ncbi:Glutathione peroxidase [Macleaya cordata]|uniref:Glutathione peroxidase n=1 Tax=Macleaya cordata TaxID=56857 RepID=A0A200Q2B2_MACCD|nr:Glutathione peroxidase [Macleaya cordata]